MDYFTGQYTIEKNILTPSQIQTFNNNNFIQQLRGSKLSIRSNNKSDGSWIMNWQNNAMINMMLTQIPDAHAISFEHKTYLYETSEIDAYKRADNYPSSMFSLAYGTHAKKASIKFHHISRGMEIFNVLDEHLQDQKALSMALQNDRFHKIRIYKNILNQPNTYHFVTNQFNWTFVRKIIALLPKLFPELIGDHLKEDQMDLCKLYGSGSSDVWFQAFIDWYNNGDFLKKARLKALEGFFERRKAKVISTYEGNLQTFRNNIANAENTILAQYQEIERVSLLVFALKNKEDNDSIPEILDYLTRHRYIVQVEAPGENYLTVDVVAPIVYYDDEILKKMIANKKSGMYTVSHLPHLSEIFNRIFIEHRYELYMATTIVVDLKNFALSCNESNVSNCLPHTHLVRYQCWGNNKSRIIKAFQEERLLEAFEQIVAACMNFNFTDSTVYTAFLSYIGQLYNRTTIRDVQTGQMYSFKQLDTIIAQEKEDERHAETNTSNTGTEG